MLPKQLTIWQKVRLQVQEKLLQPKLGDMVEKVSEAYRRRYFRHVFAENDVAFVHIHGSKLRVLNLSYGGMRVERPALLEVQSWLKVHQSTPVELTILGETQKAQMIITSLDEESVGFSCDARSPFSLLFLHRYISFMDMGLSLKALAKHKVGRSYQSPQWLSYGNERGLVEIHVNMDDSSPLPEVHIYCVNGSRYDCVWFRAPRKISVSCKPRAELKNSEKREILGQTLCLLLGMRQIGKSNRLDPYIKIAMEHLLPAAKDSDSDKT
ncbi:MAG: hypothetical protein EOP07_01725 [Proteobacteria bacterium]|nr:MAG: hypothetical protein EOP07_01725 [Pseudomonadota bacterium]